MSKTPLTADLLLQSGFTEVGCWELDGAADLTHRIALPLTAGVYAFVIDGLVQYVGLASKSVRQRLNFYRKPAASQRTNVRLNEIIRGKLRDGAIVQILIGHPPDHLWNGFRIKGAEGLEAGIIEQFDLPWNVRGVQPARPTTELTAPAVGTRMEDVTSEIVELVRRRPGVTELEIAKAIYGSQAVQQQVNQQCRRLVALGRLSRSGAGGARDPFAYRLKN